MSGFGAGGPGGAGAKGSTTTGGENCVRTVIFFTACWPSDCAAAPQSPLTAAPAADAAAATPAGLVNWLKNDSSPAGAPWYDTTYPRIPTTCVPQRCGLCQSSTLGVGRNAASAWYSMENFSRCVNSVGNPFNVTS